MSESAFGPSDHPSVKRERLELLFAEYVERLNTGERIDPREIIEEHSELAADLLRELDVYESLQSGDVDAQARGPLGTLGDYTLRRQIGRGGDGGRVRGVAGVRGARRRPQGPAGRGRGG